MAFKGNSKAPQSAVDLGRRMLDVGDYDVALTKFVAVLKAGPESVLTEVADHFLMHGIIGGVDPHKAGSGGKTSKPKKLGGKPKSSRLEAMERRATKLARDIAHEREAIMLVEERFVARVARDITMKELWKLTNAKLGNPRDNSPAIGAGKGKYTTDQLAKYKIIVG